MNLHFSSFGYSLIMVIKNSLIFQILFYLGNYYWILFVLVLGNIWDGFRVSKDVFWFKCIIGVIWDFYHQGLNLLYEVNIKIENLSNIAVW
jgi:hypothetical protein